MPAATTSALPAAAARRSSARAVGRSLVALTKPRIIELLLVTTIPAMLLAKRGLPSPGLLAATAAGGALAAGSANVVNCVIDRDIDAVMRRTSRRPLAKAGPSPVVKPGAALAFGIALGAVSTATLGLLANWLAAALADAAIVVYVFVYTLWLKRRTPSNIVIGGAAGCFPVLVGWSAVTGSVSVPAVVLFAIVFFWTPPHFWALAMKFREDYVAAGVPMLPAVAPASAVARKVLAYSYAMVAATLALAPYAGWIYTAVALGLGGWFLAQAHRLKRRVADMEARRAARAKTAEAGAGAGPAQPGAGPAQPGAGPAPMRLFRLSISYLTLLFAAVAVAALLPWGGW